MQRHTGETRLHGFIAARDEHERDTALAQLVSNGKCFLATEHDVQKRSVDTVRGLDEPQTFFDRGYRPEWHSPQGFQILNHFEGQERFILNHENMQPLKGVGKPFLLFSAHRLLSGQPRSDQNGNI